MSTSDDAPLEPTVGVPCSHGKFAYRAQDGSALHQREGTICDDPAAQRAEIEPWHYRDRRVRASWGAWALFLGLLFLIVGTLIYVIANWPQGEY